MLRYAREQEDEENTNVVACGQSKSIVNVNAADQVRFLSIRGSDQESAEASINFPTD